MDLQTILFLALGIVTLAVAVVSAFALIHANKAEKKIDELLEKGNVKDFKDIFLGQKKRQEDLAEELKEAFAKIKGLEKVLETTIQKTSIVRFNPFNDMGGNQSFSIALLDENNNGFVISSLFVSGGGRVYAKSVKDGKSEFTLLKEEIKAIDQAIHSHG